jgi:hypothetical protein
MRLASIVTAALLLAVGCSKTPEPEASAPPPRPAATTGSGAATGASTGAPPRPEAAQKPADVAYDAPASWEKAENPSPMRKATYKIKRADGDPEDAELSVSQAGGTVEANIARWTGQFEKSKGDATKRSDKQIGELKVSLVEIHGTFAGGGMPGAAPAAPKPGWAMLGAIVETSTPTFFKLTGPEKTVVAARADFEKMLDTLRAK